MPFVNETRLEFRGSLTSNTQTILKNIVIEIVKTISQKFSKGTQSRFHTLVHTVASFE